MPTLGYIKKQNGFYQGQKTAQYGGASKLCKTFLEARQFVNGSLGVKAKIVDITTEGPAGPHGGPTTWQVYTPD